MRLPIVPIEVHTSQYRCVHKTGSESTRKRPTIFLDTGDEAARPLISGKPPHEPCSEFVERGLPRGYLGIRIKGLLGFM